MMNHECLWTTSKVGDSEWEHAETTSNIEDPARKLSRKNSALIVNHQVSDIIRAWCNAWSFPLLEFPPVFPSMCSITVPFHQPFYTSLEFVELSSQPFSKFHWSQKAKHVWQLCVLKQLGWLRAHLHNFMQYSLRTNRVGSSGLYRLFFSALVASIFCILCSSLVRSFFSALFSSILIFSFSTSFLIHFVSSIVLFPLCFSLFPFLPPAFFS